MKSLLDQHQVSTPNTVVSPQKSKHNLNIRLACIEDGLDNTGFRKIAAFIKSIHSNTTVAYVPTANHRNCKQRILNPLITVYLYVVICLWAIYRPDMVMRGCQMSIYSLNFRGGGLAFC